MKNDIVEIGGALLGGGKSADLLLKIIASNPILVVGITTCYIRYKIYENYCEDNKEQNRCKRDIAKCFTELEMAKLDLEKTKLNKLH